VELAKPVIAEGGPAAATTRRVLGHVLDQLLRLLHPIIPFVTDELWSGLTGKATIVREAWPAPDPSYVDDQAEATLAALQVVVTEVRRFRADQGLRPGQRVATRLSDLKADVAPHERLIRSLARLDEPGPDFAATASLAVAGGTTVELDTRGSIDVGAERARLDKDRAAAEKEITQCQAKLGNPAFADKAPADVVAKIRERLAAAEADLERVTGALARLA
jgi:valyl-tRNA synthetase